MPTKELKHKIRVSTAGRGMFDTRLSLVINCSACKRQMTSVQFCPALKDFLRRLNEASK